MSAATNNVVLARNFDITRLSYSQPKQLSNGGKTIFVNYSGSQFYLQTPEMKAPFGVKTWPGENGGPDKHSIDMSFEGMEGREQLQLFFNALQAIDKRLVVDAMENSQLWFKKKYPSVAVVEALYSPTIRHHKDRETGEITNQYPPTFKVTLPFKDGRFQFPVYGGNRTELNMNDIIQSGRSKGARVQAIVQLTGVWLVGGKFGASWKVRQLRLSEPVRLSGWAFQPTDEDDDAGNSTSAAAPAAGHTGGSGIAGGRADNGEGLLPESDEDDGDGGLAAARQAEDEENGAADDDIEP